MMAMTSFWHWLVIAITFASIAGCVWLLLANSRRRKDDSADTGHVWDDDLRELNNPLPRWWFNLFLITVIAALIYLACYPGLGNLPGQLGWSQHQQLEAGLAAIHQRHEAAYAAFKGKDVLALSVDPKARAAGHDIFLKNCAGCHGADAQGARGFPNLTDNDWLYGGKPENIVASITNGRNGMMPPLGAAMPPATLEDVVQTVAHWQDGKVDPAVRERGMAQFAIMCAACHGPDGKGNQLLGSANLTDNIWLHGGSVVRIRETITKGRSSMMPAHKDILAADDINLVAAYVYSLSSHQP